MSSWQPRPDAFKSPVCIIGAGVLGRRLATMWASRGGEVHIVDKIQSVREDALKYFEETEKPSQVGLLQRKPIFDFLTHCLRLLMCCSRVLLRARSKLMTISKKL